MNGIILIFFHQIPNTSLLLFAYNFQIISFSLIEIIEIITD